MSWLFETSKYAIKLRPIVDTCIIDTDTELVFEHAFVLNRKI